MPEHEPVIHLDASDRINGRVDARIPLLPGDTVTVDLPGDGTQTDYSFRNHVPHLGPLLADGTLHDSVKGAIHPHAYVAAYLKYPAGQLTAVGLYEHPAEFRMSTGQFVAKHCLAREVRFTAQSRKPIVILTINGREGRQIVEPLRGGATVRHDCLDDGEHRRGCSTGCGDSTLAKLGSSRSFPSLIPGPIRIHISGEIVCSNSGFP